MVSAVRVTLGIGLWIFNFLFDWCFLRFFLTWLFYGNYWFGAKIKCLLWNFEVGVLIFFWFCKIQRIWPYETETWFFLFFLWFFLFLSRFCLWKTKHRFFLFFFFWFLLFFGRFWLRKSKNGFLFFTLRFCFTKIIICFLLLLI